MQAQDLVERLRTAVRILVWVGCLAGWAAPCRADGWGSLPPMPTARDGLAAATDLDRNLIYALGGSDDDGVALATVEVYNPRTNTWRTVAPMPTARQNLAAVAVGGFIYALGGSGDDGIALATVEAYNLDTDSWSTVASMLDPRTSLGAAVAFPGDGRIYAVGGSNRSGQLATAEAYDLHSGTWTSIAPMSTRRDLPAAVSLGGLIYVLAGYNLDDGYLTTTEVYDPAMDTWSAAAPLPTRRGGPAAAVAYVPDPKIYVLGGSVYDPLQGHFIVLDRVEAYDPATNTWSAAAPMPTARASLAAATGRYGGIYALGGSTGRRVLSTAEVYGDSPWQTKPPLAAGVEAAAATRGLDGITYVLGGSAVLTEFASEALYDVQRFDGDGNALGIVPTMPTARWGLAATTGLDGKIYAIGGYNPLDYGYSGYLKTVEAYDPSTNQWSSLAPLPFWRSNHAAATGSDGTIYVMGGFPLSFQLVTYDPASNSWNDPGYSAWMIRRRASHAAVTGPDGRIYAIGGFGGNGISEDDHFLHEVEAYNPSTHTWEDVAPMSTPRAGLAAAVGSDGRIYVVGGNNDTSQYLATVEAYDPSTNSWSIIAPMPTARTNLVAAAGDFGTILAIGGRGQGTNTQVVLPTVEVYVP